MTGQNPYLLDQQRGEYAGLPCCLRRPAYTSALVQSQIRHLARLRGYIPVIHVERMSSAHDEGA